MSPEESENPFQPDDPPPKDKPDDKAPEQFDPLEDRPGDDSRSYDAVYWDITVKGSPTNRNPLEGWWSKRLRGQIRAIALKNDLDPILLLTVLLARYGDRGIATTEQQIKNTATKLGKKPKNIGINKWFTSTFGRPTGQRVSDYIGVATTTGYEVKFPSRSGQSDRTDSVTDILEDLGPQWANKYSLIEDVARNESFGDDLQKVGPVELLAVLVARGLKPNEINKALVRAQANTMVETNWRDTDIDSWFRAQYGKPAGRAPSAIISFTPVDRPSSTRDDIVDDLAGDEIRADLTDPEVTVFRRKGTKGVFVDPTGQKGKALLVNGAPVRASDWTRAKRYYDDIYTSYTGRKPNKNGFTVKDRELIQILRRGYTDTAIANALSKMKTFKKSKVWRAAAPGMRAAAKAIFGQDYEPPEGIVRQAIVENWDQATYEHRLRRQPEYVNSNEFKTNSIRMGSVYQKVWGEPDDQAQTIIDEATMAGWSPERFQEWLRTQPNYRRSTEFTRNMEGLVSGLAPLLGGDVEVAPVPDREKIDGQNPEQLPDDKLVAGSPKQKPPPAEV